MLGFSEFVLPRDNSEDCATFAVSASTVSIPISLTNLLLVPLTFQRKGMRMF
jgi:hypothetical protein